MFTVNASAKANKLPSECVIFQEIISEWDEQERLAQEKAEQESSLYRYKNRNSTTALSEEEEEEREFRKQFPLHEKVEWWWAVCWEQIPLVPHIFPFFPPLLVLLICNLYSACIYSTV